MMIILLSKEMGERLSRLADIKISIDFTKNNLSNYH